MNSKRITTFIFTTIILTLICFTTGCNKKDDENIRELSICENKIKASIDEKEFIWHDGRKGKNALWGTIVSDIKITNYQVKNISLEKIEELFKDNTQIFVEGTTDRLLQYIQQQYTPENVSVDVSFLAQYYYGKTERLNWTCYLTTSKKTLFYCHLHKK